MKLQQPIWPRFLSTQLVLSVARLGPVGRRLPAPGTWGSVAGMLYFILIFYKFGPVVTVLLSMIAGYFAVALCGEAEFRLGRKDPGEVILDEFVVMPLCYLGFHFPDIAGAVPKIVVLLGGFAFFRLFDILKPFGIRRLQDLPGGWGVVIDDVAAALAACASLHLAHLLWLHFGH